MGRSMSKRLANIVTAVLCLHVAVTFLMMIHAFERADIPFTEYVVTMPLVVGWTALPLWLMRSVARGPHDRFEERSILLSSLLIFVSSVIVYCISLYGRSDAQMVLVFVSFPAYQLIVFPILIGILKAREHLTSSGSPKTPNSATDSSIHNDHVGST